VIAGFMSMISYKKEGECCFCNEKIHDMVIGINYGGGLWGVIVFADILRNLNGGDERFSV